ncbi:MAG: class I SAM-dependent methyltransferase [Syntrophales bacterium]|nr:class I SAM-dependent methyltransferase [Syntrophales bacterium]
MEKADNTTPHKARDYDINVRKTIPFYDTIHREIIDLVLTVKPDAQLWLDTGCGTGFTIEQAYPRFPDTHFIICDPSEKMLEEAHKRLKDLPPERLTILKPAATQDLEGVVETRVDVVTAVQAHLYLHEEERRRATETCFKLLKDGGLYVTSENIHPLTATGVDIGLKRWMNFQLAAGRSKEEVAGHAARFNRNYFPISVEEHLQLLRTTGFKVGEIFWYSQMQAAFYAIK